MFYDTLKASIARDKVVQTVNDFLWKFLYHFIHTVEFINRNIFRYFTRKVICIVDGVFFIFAVQPDTLLDFLIVQREREPVAHQVTLVVFAEIRNTYPHIVYHRQTPLLR
ncbi:hypothetical protein QCW_1885 [Clostridioides difficile CD69]|nr:hypothetical protein QCW_1885 [Clostridioides difficile CD69]